MSNTRVPAALRQLLLRLHFYAGVLIAPFLVISALTGLLYASSYAVEDVVYDDLRTVDETGSEPLPLSDQVRAASAAHPDWTVTGVRPADDPEDATGVLMDDGAVRESGAVPIVYVDPYTGEVQGDSTTYGSSHAGPFREWVSTFHRSLHLGETGRNYSELAASWLWVIVLAGLALWLWRKRRQSKLTALKLRRGDGLLWPRRGASGRSRSMSWHGPIGLWLALLLLFLSVTGLTWSRYAGENIGELRERSSWTTPSLEVAADEHAAHGGGAGHQHVHDEAGLLPVDSLDAVYGTARDAGLEGPLELTLPATAGGEFSVAETQRSYPVQQDELAVAVDESGTAHVTEELRFADWPFIAQVTNVAIALHMGLLFGLANQMLLAAAMLAFLTLIFLGYRMWWQRRTEDSMLGKPYPRGALRSLPWWSVALAVPVVAVVGWFLPLFGVTLLVFLVADALIGLWRRRRPEPDQGAPNDGVTRRTALGAATVTAAIAGGVGYGLGSGHEHEGEGHGHPSGGTEPFFGEHQSGIATPAQSHAMFVAFDLAEDASSASLRDLLEQWSAVADALMRGQTPPRTGYDTDEHFESEAVAAGLDPARLTVTFGLGPGAFPKTGLDAARPAKLVELPEFDGDQLNPAWSGGDLMVQVCGDDLQVVSNAFLELRKRAVGLAALRWVQHGFVSAPAGGGTPRNLMGFKDGTLNPEPEGDDFAERVWATESEPDWFTGGTYMVFRKIRMRLPNWSMATSEEQNLTIGKNRDTGAPLSGGGEFAHPDLDAVDSSGLPAVPPDSHLAVTHMAAMFRRGFNYDYGFLTQGDVSSDAVDHDHAPGTADHGHDEHPYDAGLLFAAFQADPQVFIDTQEKMAGGDRLMEFIVAEGSGVFAVPPGAAEGGFVGRGLFEA